VAPNSRWCSAPAAGTSAEQLERHRLGARQRRQAGAHVVELIAAAPAAARRRRAEARRRDAARPPVSTVTTLNSVSARAPVAQ
jgi:hypothetical protein